MAPVPESPSKSLPRPFVGPGGARPALGQPSRGKTTSAPFVGLGSLGARPAGRATPSVLDISALSGAVSAPHREEALETESVFVALAYETQNAESIASPVFDLPDVGASSSEIAPVGEAVAEAAASIADAEVAPTLHAPEAVSGSEVEASIEVQAVTPPFEDVEVSSGPEAESVMADELDTASEEQSTDSWPQGGWETPSLEPIRADVPQAIEPGQPSVQATAHGIAEESDATQLESAELTGAVYGNASAPAEAALPFDGSSRESWTEASLLMREADGADEAEEEVMEGGEEMEATPFDHLTGDRLDVLMERGPESLDALVVATEAQARAVDVLDGLARRLRSGDLVVAAGSGTSAESVLASILAALLSERS